jgi:hypothetical protein
MDWVKYCPEEPYQKENPMPDLQDGESIEMQGSGSKPYVLKNVGGVLQLLVPGMAQSVRGHRKAHLVRGGKDLRDRHGFTQSKALDPYLLLLLDPKGKKIAEDDDGEDELNARITYRTEMTANYRIICTSFEKAPNAQLVISAAGSIQESGPFVGCAF